MLPSLKYNESSILINVMIFSLFKAEYIKDIPIFWKAVINYNYTLYSDNRIQLKGSKTYYEVNNFEMICSKNFYNNHLTH